VCALAGGALLLGALLTPVSARERPGASAARSAPAVSPEGMRGLGAADRVIEISTWSTGSTKATARTYERAGARWRVVRTAMPAYVGLRGLSWPERRVAGDGTTPIGIYGFVFGFGSRRDPGVHGFAWRRLYPSACWSGTRSQYNRWVERSPCAGADEDLWSSRRVAYRYAAVIDFNYGRPVYGRGSGIFLHEQIDKPTHGCVSLSQSDLLAVLRWITPSTRIVIGPYPWLRSLRGR
jgi:L,D-peptidoglycan transpeptidase YkuD (ErfK/YbiS/YcfS/YnhG family)